MDICINDSFGIRCANPQIVPRRDLDLDEHDDRHFMVVPCGKCELCVQRLKRMWTLRIRQESSMNSDNLFATLTYDNEHVPFNIAYEDFQVFVKRFRKKYRFRYYVASEYGSPKRTWRPHFHVIFFGLRASRSLIDDMCDAWSNGYIKVNALSDARAKYACGYCEKKIGEKEDGVHEVLPFCRMSLKPGLGASWLMTNLSDVKKRFFVSFGGERWPIPRYYVKLIDDESWLCDYYEHLNAIAQERNEEFLGYLCDKYGAEYVNSQPEWFANSEWLDCMVLKCASLRRARDLYELEKGVL